MKQLERKVVALGNDAAVLCEHSNSPSVPIPRLTIHSSQFAEDGILFPATTAILYGDNVRALYDMLHEYYLAAGAQKKP